MREEIISIWNIFSQEILGHILWRWGVLTLYEFKLASVIFCFTVKVLSIDVNSL